MATIGSTPEYVSRVYSAMESTLQEIRHRLGRPMTLGEKLLLSHLSEPGKQELEAGESYLMLRPDRVALQDVTGQMALLQFIQARRQRVALPTTLHCDHLIQAREGAIADTSAATTENQEVYDFLQSASSKYGIGFWKPGSGIIHQVVLENYAFPGGLLLGTDSHTPNAGGLGSLAVGVGGADAADAMAGLPWETRYPRLIGVRLTGELGGWTSPKDIILHLCGVLTTSGGTNCIIEYFGPGTRSISCTGKATITNMGAELGATGDVFPYDERMEAYLRGTGRTGLAELANANRGLLVADPEVEAEPETYFDLVVDIDLSRLEPQVSGPHRPDLVRPISALAAEVAEQGYPDQVSVALIGSCTNSSYEDMGRAADVARQAQAHGIKINVPLLVTPGSEQVRATIERDGQMEAIKALDATVLANACGPCIGQWRREELQPGEANTIVTSFNRNFPRRNDGNAQTMAFIGSPETVIAYALSGRLSFNPLTDKLQAPDGTWFRLAPPQKVPDLPDRGFARGDVGYVPPADDGSSVEVAVDPKSDRLQVLEPFSPWDGRDFTELPLLLKAYAQCTTDHISPAGPWLRYRGHLDNLSNNMFLGAVNAFTGETGKGMDLLAGKASQPFSQIARGYREAGQRWVVVGDENYGEGSSREHAAMSPRLLGAAAVIVRSFARIHESNLKKQGVLGLTFEDPADYDRVQETDRVSIMGLSDLAPGSYVTCHLHHIDGSTDTISLRHTLSETQIAWFRAGSALNLLSQKEEG